jgi:hypothetical protein
MHKKAEPPVGMHATFGLLVGALPGNNKYTYFITPIWRYCFAYNTTPRIGLYRAIKERDMHLIQGTIQQSMFAG